MAVKKGKETNALIDNVKSGFWLGIGSMLSSIIFIFIGMLFFFPGLILLNKEREKTKEMQNQTNIIIAYVLMALGALFSMGMGFNFIASNFMEDF